MGKPFRRLRSFCPDRCWDLCRIRHFSPKVPTKARSRSFWDRLYAWAAPRPQEDKADPA